MQALQDNKVGLHPQHTMSSLCQTKRLTVCDIFGDLTTC
jgi:hypothetical protein